MSNIWLRFSSQTSSAAVNVRQDIILHVKQTEPVPQQFQCTILTKVNNLIMTTFYGPCPIYTW